LEASTSSAQLQYSNFQRKSQPRNFKASFASQPHHTFRRRQIAWSNSRHTLGFRPDYRLPLPYRSLLLPNTFTSSRRTLSLYQQPYLHHLSHRLLFLSTHLHTTTIMAAAFTSVPAHGDAKPSSPVDLSTIPISPNGTNGHDENKNPNGESSTDEEQITVFHDKDNFNVKHPLMHKWTLWFTKPPSGKASLRRVTPTSNTLTFLSRVTTGTIC
jgi:hypothetical protein